MTERAAQVTENEPQRAPSSVAFAVAGVLVVLVLGAATRFLEQNVPTWADGTALEGVAKSIEFPVYAIALGLLGNFVLSRLALRDALATGFRTEFFIKTGLVLLGASINLKLLVTAAGPAIAQALLLITIVFGFTGGWAAGSASRTNSGHCSRPQCRSAVSARRLPQPVPCRPNANSWHTQRRW